MTETTNTGETTIIKHLEIFRNRSLMGPSHLLAHLPQLSDVKAGLENHPNQIDHDRDHKFRQDYHHRAVPVLNAPAATEAR